MSLRSANRSLFEGSLGFLMEAEGDEQELEDLMPKAVSLTLKAFNDISDVFGIPDDVRDLLGGAAQALSKHTSDPETEDALKDFKTAEELHASLVKVIDRYTAQLVAMRKSGNSPKDEAGRKAILDPIITKALDESSKLITDQIASNSILKRAYAKIKGTGDISKRIKDLTGFEATKLQSFAANDFERMKGIALNPKFKAQRTVQGKVVSQEPNLPKEDTSKKDRLENFKSVVGKLDDYKKAYEWLFKKKAISEDAYSNFEILVEDIESANPKPSDPKFNLEDFEKKLGGNQKQMVAQLIADAEDNFGKLRASLKSMSRSGAEPAAGGKGEKGAGEAGGEASGGKGEKGAGEAGGEASGGKEGKEGGAPAEGAPSQSLRSMLFQKDSNLKRSSLDPKATSLKSSLDDLTQVWQNYNSDPKKFGKKGQADLVAKLNAAQDALKGVKLEGTKNEEEVIIERWQRMAGIL